MPGIDLQPFSKRQLCIHVSHASCTKLPPSLSHMQTTRCCSSNNMCRATAQHAVFLFLHLCAKHVVPHRLLRNILPASFALNGVAWCQLRSLYPCMYTACCYAAAQSARIKARRENVCQLHVGPLTKSTCSW